MEEAGTGSADITEFVPIDSIRPGILRQGLYLARTGGASRTRCCESVRESDRCAIGAGQRAASNTSDDPPDENAGRIRPHHAAAALRRRGEIDEGHRDPERPRVKDAELKLRSS